MKTRLCTKCGEVKPLTSEFFVKDKYDITGFTYRCKICRNRASYEWAKKNPEKVKEANLKNTEKRKIFYNSLKGIESSRRAHLKRKYNITLEEFNERLKNQNYKCAICGGVETHDKHGVFAVDHDHKTGKIRDLLCWKCNAGLGLYNDNKELLINAVKYLEKHEPTIIM